MSSVESDCFWSAVLEVDCKLWMILCLLQSMVNEDMV